MIWLIVAYVMGILPATVAVAALDELTSNRARFPSAVHLSVGLFWPVALFVALVAGLIHVSAPWPSRLGRRISKKHKLKRMKETNGI